MSRDKCISHGQLAVEAGSPDFPTDQRSDAIDAIANILHWITSGDSDWIDAEKIVAAALDHYWHECGGTGAK